MRLAKLLVLAFAVGAAYPSGHLGTVRTINVNKGWDGVMFQLEGVNVIDANCGNHDWFFFQIGSDLDKAILSTLLTAKSAGIKVRVGTSGCKYFEKYNQKMPLVQWVDLDLRK